MKPEFIKCEFCKVEIPSETCNLAAHTTKISGKEYTFCCVSCAERYKKRPARKAKKKPK
jgi:YHS domain-containing protein